MISLQDNGYHICGGSIISNRIVITAAHCVNTYLYSFNRLTVRAGSTYKDVRNQVRTIYALVMHPSYNIRPYDYDIALIWVTVPFQWSLTVNSIPLTKYEPAAFTPLYASGWGQTTNWSPLGPSQLQSATLYILSRTQCISYWGSAITPRMICTAPSSTDVCRGDSGGPGVIFDSYASKYILAGLVSWGTVPCAKGKPSIFTNVANLRPWIYQYTGF